MGTLNIQSPMDLVQLPGLIEVFKLKTGSFYIKNSPLRGHKLIGDE